MPCRYCDGVMSLSPNWRLGSDGTGVRFQPLIVAADQRVKAATATLILFTVNLHSRQGPCRTETGLVLFPIAVASIHGEDIKRQAQAGGMGRSTVRLGLQEAATAWRVSRARRHEKSG